MKRSTLVLLVLIFVAAVGFYYFLEVKPADNTVETANAPAATITFEGQTLNVPEGWSVYAFGTRAGTLALTKPVSSGLAPTITLEDERKQPDDVNHFVSGWVNAQRVPGFHPKSLSEFHDNAVDAAGERCVQMRWEGTQRTYRVICTSSNGKWRLTLSGEDTDIAGLDGMASQMRSFLRGL